MTEGMFVAIAWPATLAMSYGLGCWVTRRGFEGIRSDFQDVKKDVAVVKEKINSLKTKKQDVAKA